MSTLPARDAQLAFQSGEAVDSGLTVSSGASTVSNLGSQVELRAVIWPGGKMDSQHVRHYFGGFLAECFT